ncbi:MCE family protein [Dactylosporangium matsuzakiense]|uniref:ABC transporter substrate-binding protein n=1 Tax=Dactylosporangium matsuzakiense TaxID=53360 RepID=A0A9W6KTG7_9ACTN|nr:MCE family protein [Dactylosporangium matsuzakiense]UWZ46991.1 MCE family protein [Dactylosporangium matsuzakiense]GLL06892.1 ABC transporter substrate-binding protein [Dactylosporangium matsuzakiense]
MSNRVLGIVFIVLLGSALGLSVLQYNKVLTPGLHVLLKTSHTGLQLSPGAEVKLYGVVVGEVRSVDSDGSAAALRLVLDPELAPQIPAAVSARLLPKTLFGERYVALIPPAVSVRAIRDGDVISQDRSSSALELERVLDDTLPLLQAVQPDKLAATLGALATALEGKGDQLGRDIGRLDTYLASLNEDMPLIAEDVRRLAAVLDVYDGALPDLLNLLRDASVTAGTVTEQRDQLATFWTDTTAAADTTRYFLERHGDQLIKVGDVSRPVLELLAAYAPEYPCLLQGLVALQPRVEQAFTGGRMHITLEVTRDNGKYLPGDRPAYGADNGPNCRGLPGPGVPAPGVPINDGYDYGTAHPGTTKLPVGTIPATAGGQTAGAPPSSEAGSPEERKLLEPLIGGAMGVPPVEVPDIAMLLWGPLLRGAVVGAK